MLKKHVALVLTLLSSAQTFAVPTFAVGQKVDVAVSGGDLTNAKNFQLCTIKKIDLASGGYGVNCSGTDYFVSSSWVRASKDTRIDTPSAAHPAQERMPNQTPPGKAPPRGRTVTDKPRGGDTFKISDRVMAAVGGLVNRESAFEPCTIVSDLHSAGGEWGVKCDSTPTRVLNVRADWMRHSANAGIDPATPACPFTKGYARPAKNAPPSEALFKSVIFDWENSTQRYKDFGITFSDFRTAKSFVNRERREGHRDIDVAPIGATIYPFKTRQLNCVKDLTITQRILREVDYFCYKNRFNEWFCASGQVKDLERKSFLSK